MLNSTTRSPTAVDEHLSVLARDDCRTVLQYFRRRSTDVGTVDDLAEFICERRETRDRTRVAIALHHSILPKLADAGLIDYDARSNAARYGANPPVEEWLDRVERGEISV